MTPITQDQINKAAWGACDTFRGVVDPSIYKDYVLTMLFLKYVSDVWKDHRARYEAEHGDHPDLIDAMMQQEAFVLPEKAGFDHLHSRRHEAGNGERIDKALHAIEEANLAKLLCADASWAAAEACLQTHGGFGFAEEYDVERKYREARLYQVAPISTNLILSFVAQHVLGMPRSY